MSIGSPIISLSAPSLSQNRTVLALAPTVYEHPSSSSIHDTRLPSLTLGSSQLSTAHSDSVLTSSPHAYSTGVLPVRPLESLASSTISSQNSIPLGLASSPKGLPVPSSGNIALESASPTAQTVVEIETQASSTPNPANAEAASTESNSDVESLSSTWQVGISPIAYAASSVLSDQSTVYPTSKTGYGGLGSLIWSGLAGSLPTDNTGAVSGQLDSTILTGYSTTSVVVPSNGFGTGAGTGTGVGSNTGPVDPGVTKYSQTVQTYSSQIFPSGSGSSAFYSPRYSFSWKFNTSSTRQPIGTGVDVPTTTTSHHSALQPSPHGGDNESNATCGGVTVNIPDATLDYWYTTTLDYAAATFSIQFDGNDSATGWTLLPASTTFNVTDALQDPTTYYVPSTITNHANTTSISYYTTVDISPTPVYASTVVVTQTATSSISSSSGRGDIPSDAVITPPPASTVLSAGPNQPSLTALTNTHFVYFSQYALDTEHTTTHKNGTPACVTSREIKHLGRNFAMAYFGDDPDGQALVTGALSEEFLGMLPPHLKFALGVFTAEPTLIVPVQVDYAAEAVLAVSQTAESTQAKSYGSYPIAYSSAYAATSYQIVPSPASSTRPAFAPVFSSLQLPRPPVIFLKPTDTSSIAVTQTQLATNFYIVSPTSTSARVEKTQTQLDLGPYIEPTQVPVGGQTGAKGDSDTNSGVSGSSGQGSNAGSGSGSGSGSNGGSGSISNGGSSNGNSGSGSNNNGNSGSSGGSQTGGTSGGSNTFSGNSGGSGNSDNSGSSGGNSQGSNSGGSNSGNSGGSGGSSSNGNFNPGSASSGGNDGSGASSGGSSNDGSQNGNTGGSSGGSGSSGNGGSGSNAESGGNVIIPVPVIITVGSTKATVNPGSSVIIGTQTLVPQRAAITIDGTPVSIGPTAVIVGDETHAFQGSTFQAAVPGAPTAITFGGTVITQVAVPVYKVGGTDVHAGEVVTISGTVVSAASSGGVLVIGSDTLSIGTPNSPITLSTAGRQVIVNPTPAFVVDSQTLAAGGPAVTVDGTRLSLAPSATAIVVGSQTSQIAASADPTRGALLTIGSKTFTADISTHFSIASGLTLAPGGSATIDGTTVHLGPSGFLASLAVVNGVTQTLSPPLVTPAPAFYLGGNAYGTNGGAAFVVDGQVLTPGGAITVSGTPVSFVKEGTAVVVGGFTQRLPLAHTTAPPVLNFGGQVYTAQAGSAFVVDGKTLTRGGVITVSGTQVSYLSEGTAVVVNGKTQALTQASSTLAPVLTIGGQAYTARTGSNFVINGATLIPGGQITVDGTTISLVYGDNTAIVNGVSQTLSHGTSRSGAILSIGGRTYTAGSGPNFVIGDQTLIPGEAISFDGTSVSLVRGGSAVVVNGVTQTLSSGSSADTAAVLTIGGQTYTARSGTSYMIGGQTLVAGSAVTVDGTTISLQSEGTAAVINGVTQSLSQATATAVLNIGGKTYTAQSGTFVIEGRTLKPGAMITVDGTTVSLAPDETTAVVNGITTTLAQITAPAALTFGGHVYAAQTGSAYVIDGKTLTPGGIMTLAGGTTVSLASSGSFIVINGVTSNIPGTAAATPTSVLTVGGKTYTASSGSYVIDGQALTSGGVITLSDGTTLSLGASELIINGQTSTLPTVQSISPGIITIEGQTFTSLAGNTAAPSYIINGQTLKPSGSKITATMSGTTYIITLSAGASTVEIQVLGSGGRVISTIYETLRGSGIGATTVTATQDVQGGAAASPTSQPSLTAAPTQGNSASLQNAAAPTPGGFGFGIAAAALIAGALAVLL
jgi:hypothetical protein